jgi:hypothetical protein
LGVEAFKQLATQEGVSSETQSTSTAENTQAENRPAVGIQAMSSLYEHVENLPQNAWKELARPAKYAVKTEPRRRPANVKQKVVEDRKFTDIRLAKEYVSAGGWVSASRRTTAGGRSSAG